MTSKVLPIFFFSSQVFCLLTNRVSFTVYGCQCSEKKEKISKLQSQLLASSQSSLKPHKTSITYIPSTQHSDPYWTCATTAYAHHFPCSTAEPTQADMREYGTPHFHFFPFSQPQWWQVAGLQPNFVLIITRQKLLSLALQTWWRTSLATVVKQF